MHPISLLIIDDHTLIRQTWSFILNADHRFTVLGETGSAEEGIELCRQLKPDMVMLDINLPDMNGIAALPIFLQNDPDVKVLGVSLHDKPIYVKKMMQAGAMGYITKNSHRQEMIHALLEIGKGKKYICDEIKNILSESILKGKDEVSLINSLSTREIEIIEMIKKGLSSREIAEEAFISVKTVEVHRYNILKKLNLKNSAELVNFMNHNYSLN
jgi:DNA-binding NarL/FixJ family response regulator